MKQENDIFDKIGKDPGFRVPDDYFEDFAKKMAAQLPEKKFTVEKKTTVWLSIRPWVYMAAMFAGIWCMMYIFSDIKNASSKNLGFNPEIADAMNDEQFVNEFMMTGTGNISDYDLLMEIYNEGVDASVFDSDSIN